MADDEYDPLTLSTPRQRLLDARLLDASVEPQVDSDEKEDEVSRTFSDLVPNSFTQVDKLAIVKRKLHSCTCVDIEPVVATVDNITTPITPEDHYNFEENMLAYSSILSSVDDTLKNLKSWREENNADESVLNTVDSSVLHSDMPKYKELDEADDVNPYDKLVKKTLLTSRSCCDRFSNVLEQHNMSLKSENALVGSEQVVFSPPDKLFSPEQHIQVKLQNLMSEVALNETPRISDLSEELSNINFGLELGEELDDYACELEDLLKELDSDLE